jgi:hypothetical protein
MDEATDKRLTILEARAEEPERERARPAARARQAEDRLSALEQRCRRLEGAERVVGYPDDGTTHTHEVTHR